MAQQEAMEAVAGKVEMVMLVAVAAALAALD